MLDAPTDLGGGPFSDVAVVTPAPPRLGPQTTPRILFTNDSQWGAFWELSGGDVLTTFQTARTPIFPGSRTYTLSYRLRRIVGTTVQNMPDAPAGTCDDDGGEFTRPCPAGYSADYPDLSVVMADGTIRIVSERGQVVRLDPTTGEVTRLMHADTWRTVSKLVRLPTGQLVVVGEPTAGAGDWTAVVDADLRPIAAARGGLQGHRDSPFALLLRQSPDSLSAFRWWDARSGALTPAFSVPMGFDAGAGAIDTLRVSATGDVLLATNYQMMHVTSDGRLRYQGPYNPYAYVGVLPDVSLATFEGFGTDYLDSAVFIRTAELQRRAYTLADLIRDTGWRYDARFGPYLDSRPYGVVDDAGNVYVSFQLRSSGSAGTCYLVALSRTGARLWGFMLPYASRQCVPEAILSGRRLVVRCRFAYTQRFIILGE